MDLAVQVPVQYCSLQHQTLFPSPVTSTIGQKTKIMASGPITSWQIDEETMETVRVFFWAPKSLQMVTAAMKLKDACSWEE